MSFDAFIEGVIPVLAATLYPKPKAGKRKKSRLKQRQEILLSIMDDIYDPVRWVVCNWFVCNWIIDQSLVAKR